MNKNRIVSVLLSAAFIAAPGAALASDVDCGGCGNGSPLTLTMQWGLTAGETPVVASGTSFSDERGLKFECPFWYPAGCYNITKTHYYRAQHGYVR